MPYGTLCGGKPQYFIVMERMGCAILWAMTTEEGGLAHRGMIEPGEYGLAPPFQKAGDTWPVSLNKINLTANHRTVVESAETLGVSLYRLGVLLGLKSTNQVYHWKNGTKRMSAPYALRLIKLLNMGAVNVPVAAIHRIDWDAGVITWSKGYESIPTGGGWDVRRGVSGDRYGIPNGGGGPGQEAGNAVHPEREADILLHEADPVGTVPRSVKFRITDRHPQ